MQGKTVSHYQVLEKLGGGGMGVVYRAKDTHLDRFVALKFLPPELTKDPLAIERFILEAKAASSLDHPNICNIHEINQTEDGQLFIVMAFYKGETLKKKLAREGCLPVESAVTLAQQVAEGLAEAHAHGMMHRDIKPANIMVTDEGVAKIVDFGLAKLSDQTTLTRTGSTVGTAAYMSPEQAEGRVVDERTDIWSFGVVLFEMLTGYLPFRGDHPLAVMFAIVNDEPLDMGKSPNTIPAYLGELCRRCLEKDPGRRPQSMSEALTLLAGAPAKRGPGRHVWISRVPVGRLVAVAGVILLLVAGLWYLRVRWPGTPALEGEKLKIGLLLFQTPGDTATRTWPDLIQMLLFQDLSRYERLAVMDFTALNSLLEGSFKTGRPPHGTGFYDLIREENITHLIDGKLWRSGSAYKIFMQIIDGRTGTGMYTYTDSIVRDEQLPEVIGTFSKEAAAYLDVAEETKQRADLQPWLAPPVQHPQALWDFYMASQYVLRNELGGQVYLLRALEQDSTYIAPRIWLISGLIQRNQLEEAERHFEVLWRLEPRASFFEKAMIEWCRAYMEKDLLRTRYTYVARIMLRDRRHAAPPRKPLETARRVLFSAGGLGRVLGTALQEVRAARQAVAPLAISEVPRYLLRTERAIRDMEPRMVQEHAAALWS